MRTLIFSLLASILALPACGGAQKMDTTNAAPETSLPADYQSWPHINAETIIRNDEDDDGTVTSSSAVELYAKVAGDLAAGTILVKATHAVAGEELGAVERIGLMRRGTGDQDGGWQFEAYDPTSRAKADTDVATCINCHSLQAENDFLFSTREDVLNAAPRAAPGAAPAEVPEDPTAGDAPPEG